MPPSVMPPAPPGPIDHARKQLAGPVRDRQAASGSSTGPRDRLSAPRASRSCLAVRRGLVAPTSTVAFLGEAARGPLQQRQIGSYAEYVRHGSRRGVRSRQVSSLRDQGFLRKRSGPATLLASLRRTRSQHPLGSAPSRSPRSDPERPATGSGSGFGAGAAPGSDGVTGFRLEIYLWEGLDEDDAILDGAIFDPVAEPDRLPRPDRQEVFPAISLDPAHSNHWGKSNTISSLVTLSLADDATLPDTTIARALTGGADGGPTTLADFKGEASDPD